MSSSPTPAPTRPLGAHGPPVSALGFGAMGLSAFYGAVPSDTERFAVLDRAYELGQTFWDTADVYGDNEDLIGQWFARTGKRDEIFLATKFANRRFADGRMEVRSDKEYVREACEKSLRRLGVEKIDLYYCHRVDGKTPIEETVRAMVELKNEGKITHLGLSEVSSTTLRRAHAIHPITALQIEYSPFTTDIEHPSIGLLSTCRALGVAIVAYSPLGRGFVTGTYRSRADFEPGDFRLIAPRFSEENFPKNLELVDKLAEIAKRKGCTPGQLTLAWLLAKGEDVIPIPGTKKIKYLEENWGAVGVRLENGEKEEIDEAVKRADVRGGRYPEELSSRLFGETPEEEEKK